MAAAAMVLAGLIGGCAQAPSAVSSAASGRLPLRATAALHWNEYARELVGHDPSAPAARVFPYLALAQHNAAVLARQRNRDTDGAVAGASAAALAFFFRNHAQAIDANLAREVAALGANAPRHDFAAGVDIGRRAAAEVIAAAVGDQSDVAWSGTIPDKAGTWMSQARPPAPPLFTGFVGMRPFYLMSGSEFRAPPPPALESEVFRNALLEVRTVADNRTTEQLRIAQYWEQTSGAFMPGWWNQTTLDAAVAHHLSQEEATRVLALVHMAWADAFIACNDSKYAYWVPRPSQVDPQIRLAIEVPNHPSYPSNHSCTASAAARVLDGMFPDQGGRYLVLAHEVAMSRLFGGIHYRIDIEAGLDIGRKVATKVLAEGLPPDRVWPPSQQ